VEQITASPQGAQSKQSNTAETEAKAYEVDLMRRMGFAEKEIARDAEREHNWRIKHYEAQEKDAESQIEEAMQYARERVRKYPACIEALRYYKEARSLHAKGNTDEANQSLEVANKILAYVQNLEREDASLKEWANHIEQLRQQADALERQAAVQAKRQKEEDAEAEEEDEESYGKLKGEVEHAQFFHAPASSISTFGLENNHSNPDLDRLERQVDYAKFSHEPASAIHP